MIFERWTQPFPKPDGETPPATLWAFCRYYARGFGAPLLVVAVTGILLAVMEVSLFAFLGKIVNWLSHAHRETFLRDEGGHLALMGAVLLFFLPLTNALSTLARNQALMGNFPMSIRWRMHHHLLAQSLLFFQDEFAGRVAAKVMQTALAVRQLLVKITDILIYISVYFCSMFVLFAGLNLWLLLPVGLWFIGYIALQIYFLPRLKRIAQQEANARSLMTGRVTDAYTNITTVKLFAHTQREADYAQSSMKAFLATVYRQFRAVSALDILVTSLNYTLIFVVTALGIALWLWGHLSVGALATATAMAMRLNGMSHWIQWEVSSLFEQIGTTSDGMQMMSLPCAVRDQAQAPTLVWRAGEIIFEQVSFSYRGRDAHLEVIRDFNLHIRPGEKIGVVGKSGAGKSTLVNALLRFYDLKSGRILIDGQDIAKVTQESLRAHIGVVTQDTALLHRSVRDNILYGRPDASEEQLHHALEKAQALDFIAQLADPQGHSGLDAQVGERGVKLSGGQRQRIAIARVLLKDAPILILDEATSALDSQAEAAIQRGLKELMVGKTVIAIAHRLSTIAEMDRLIVLEHGRIVEEGNHQTLLAQGGIYAQLWARQTGGYLGAE